MSHDLYSVRVLALFRTFFALCVTQMSSPFPLDPKATMATEVGTTLLRTGSTTRAISASPQSAACRAHLSVRRAFPEPLWPTSSPRLVFFQNLE